MKSKVLVSKECFSGELSMEKYMFPVAYHLAVYKIHFFSGIITFHFHNNPVNRILPHSEDKETEFQK